MYIISYNNMADTSNISDLPTSQSTNHTVQNSSQYNGQGQQGQMQAQAPPKMSMEIIENSQGHGPGPGQPAGMGGIMPANTAMSQGPVHPPNTQMQNNVQNQVVSTKPNMTYNEMVKTLDSKGPETVQMSNANSVSNILQSMEKMAKTGAFDLPSRDIPMQQNRIDEEVKPNYVPQANNYIDDYDTHEDIMRNHKRQQNQQDSLEVIYQKLQVPILIGMLYFFFHLPVINKWFLTYLSFAFHKDGNMNFTGYIVKSTLFGFAYLTLTLGIDLMTQML